MSIVQAPGVGAQVEPGGQVALLLVAVVAAVAGAVAAPPLGHARAVTATGEVAQRTRVPARAVQLVRAVNTVSGDVLS